MARNGRSSLIKHADQWGAFSYKEADDALRVKVKGGKTKELFGKNDLCYQ